MIFFCTFKCKINIWLNNKKISANPHASTLSLFDFVFDKHKKCVIVCASKMFFKLVLFLLNENFHGNKKFDLKIITNDCKFFFCHYRASNLFPNMKNSLIISVKIKNVSFVCFTCVLHTGNDQCLALTKSNEKSFSCF